MRPRIFNSLAPYSVCRAFFSALLRLSMLAKRPARDARYRCHVYHVWSDRHLRHAHDRMSYSIVPDATRTAKERANCATIRGQKSQEMRREFETLFNFMAPWPYTIWRRKAQRMPKHIAQPVTV